MEILVRYYSIERRELVAEHTYATCEDAFRAIDRAGALSMTTLAGYEKTHEAAYRVMIGR